MWQWVESLLAKPEDSEAGTRASLLFPLAGGLIAILAAAPAIKAWMYANSGNPHLTFWRLILPLPVAALVGSLLGVAIGAIVDRRASNQTRITILRCRQVLILLLSAAFIVWCGYRLLVCSDLFTFLVFLPIFVFLGLSQTRWRLHLSST
jgi:hypothetical protein